MLSRFSFRSIGNATIGLIFVILFSVTLIAYGLTRESSKIVARDLDDHIEILASMPQLIRNFYYIDERFHQLEENGSQDVTPCVENLDEIRSILHSPVFSTNRTEHIKETLLSYERKFRTLLYQYAAADLHDPTRDLGKESMQRIRSVMMESEAEAMRFCETTKESSHQTVLQLMQTLERTKQTLILTLLAGGVMVMVACILLKQTLVTRLRTISSAADSIRSGDLAFRIRSLFDDEIGKVGSSIDLMANQIEVTENQLREANLQLVHSLEEARAADVAKSEFLATVSHELRTPMNSIIGFSEVLRQEHLSREQGEYVQHINVAAANLLHLINEILDVSKIESGKFELVMQSCSIPDVLNRLNTLLGPTAKEKGISLSIHREEALPETITTDPDRLFQCLVNLVSNGIKFTKRGFVHVIVSQHRVGEDAYLQFAVEDSGIGIAKHKQNTIFDSFTQVDSSMNRKYGGTGLGLSITQKLVHLLGGDIRVESSSGVGSTFTFSVPIVSKAGCSPKKVVDQNVSTTRSASGEYSGEILVVEDDPDNLKLINLVLSRFGVSITVARDGQEAVDTCKAKTYDLVFMDIHMPGMNGYEATRAIREMGMDLPIIALTANAMSGDRERCLEAGCSDYIPKPFKADQIEQVLSMYLAPVSADSTSK